MFATIVFDPSVCHGDLWWLYPMCWGIPLMKALILGMPVLALTARRIVRRAS